MGDDRSSPSGPNSFRRFVVTMPDQFVDSGRFGIALAVPGLVAGRSVLACLRNNNPVGTLVYAFAYINADDSITLVFQSANVTNQSGELVFDVLEVQPPTPE